MKYLYLIILFNLPVLSGDKFDSMLVKVENLIFTEDYNLANNYINSFSINNNELLTNDSLRILFLETNAITEFYLRNYPQADSLIQASMDLYKSNKTEIGFDYVELISISNAISISTGNTQKFDNDFGTYMLLIDSLNKVNDVKDPAGYLWYFEKANEHLYCKELLNKARLINEIDYLYNSLLYEFKKRGYDKTWSYGFLLLEYSTFNYNLGLLDEHEKLIYKSLEITTADSFRNKNESYTAYNNLSANESSLGNYQLAINYADTAFNFIWNNGNFDEHAHIKMKLGANNHKLGNFELAERYYKAADSLLDVVYEIYTKNGTMMPDKSYMSYHYSLRANNYYYWGNVLLDMGKNKEAELKFSKALQIFSQYDDYDFILRSKNILLRTAVLKEYSNISNQADSIFDNVISINQYLIKNILLNLPEYMKERYLINLKTDYSIFNNFLFNHLKDSDSIPIKMLETRINTKGLLYYSSKNYKEQLRKNESKEISHLVNTQNQINSQLSNLLVRKKSNSFVNENQIDSLENISKNIDRNISRLMRLKNNDLFNKVDNWTVIRDKLKVNEAAIEIIKIPKYGYYPNKFNPKSFNYNFCDSVLYIGFIITNTSQKPDFVVFDNPDKMESIDYINYLKSIKPDKSKILSGNTKSIRKENIKNLKQAYKVYFKKIDDKLKDINKIFISNDGIFNKINLDVLIDESNKYIIDKYDISIVSSIKDIAFNDDSNNIPSNNAVLIGGADFNFSNNDGKQKITSKIKNIDNLRSAKLFEEEFSELPYTMNEVKSINNTLNASGWNSKVLSGSQASKINLNNINSPTILHIASHAYFLSEDNSNSSVNNSNLNNTNHLFINNGIILSGANVTIRNIRDNKLNSDNYNNGILTALEAINLKLDNTELVVLSACETGNGAIRNGEGVYGLQRAFQLAGAKKIILSLWKVDDEATQILLNYFYQYYILTNDAKLSLKNAQRKVRNIPKFSHPRFWGAFIVYGV